MMPFKLLLHLFHTYNCPRETFLMILFSYGLLMTRIHNSYVEMLLNTTLLRFVGCLSL